MRHSLWYLPLLCLALTLALLGEGYALHVRAADLPTSIFISICGDGLVQSTEVCDAGTGNNTGTYASSIATRKCAPGCESFGPY
jgi:hypothetical protein